MGLAYERHGSGPPLVLLHGVGHRRQAWGAVLGRLTPHRDVILVDLPGHGESPPLTLAGRPVIDAMLAEVTGLFDELALDRPHVAGNSLGGRLALEAGVAGRAATVTALSPALKQPGIFAPSSWYHDSQNDLDLGSTQPALLASGMLLADGKSGTAYLVSSARLGGVGGQVDQAQVCPAFGTAAVQGSTVYEPCEQGGLAAVSTAGSKIRVEWRGPENAWGSPVIGGGAVWVTDWKAGTLYELDQATGGIRASLGLGTPLPHFPSMSMAGGRAYLGTMDGVVSVRGV